MLKSDRESIGMALGRLPSGCAILTIARGAQATGVLVSWVQQAAFEPPMVSAAIKRGRPVQCLLDSPGPFLLNILGENPTALFRHFGRGFTLQEDAFSGLAVEVTDWGPALKDAISVLACEVRVKIAAGDHDVYISEIVSANSIPKAAPYVHVRGSGLSY